MESTRLVSCVAVTLSCPAVQHLTPVGGRRQAAGGSKGPDANAAEHRASSSLLCTCHNARLKTRSRARHHGSCGRAAGAAVWER